MKFPNPSYQNSIFLKEGFDWSQSPYFKKTEFDPQEVHVINFHLIHELNKVRHFLDTPIIPSREPGHLATETVGSYHSYELTEDVEKIKLSQAIKVFIPDLTKNYLYLNQVIQIISSVSNFRGIGFHFDYFLPSDEEELLIQLDLRHVPGIWFSTHYASSNRSYHYPETYPGWADKLETLWKRYKKDKS